MNILFKKRLEQDTGLKLKLRINDNRSTMVSVRWEPDYARVSLHRMFLQAPENVMDALACYIRGKQKISPALKVFIDYQLGQLDYSYQLNKGNLKPQGEVYHLLPLYRQINQEYFDGELNLQISWYGQPGRLRRSANLGLYTDPLKLVKIHRLLDDRRVPLFVVEFVVYHEMLHHVYPPEIDRRGRTIIHTKAFKEQEKRFTYFQEAEEWIKVNRHLFFR